MEIDTIQCMKDRLRLSRLPENLRREIQRVRRERGWSQLELGRRAGLTQRHVSGIETGRITPRYDTLLDVLRVLGRDLLPVPMEIVPVVQSLLRDYHRGTSRDAGDRPLYAVDDDAEDDDDTEDEEAAASYSQSDDDEPHGPESAE